MAVAVWRRRWPSKNDQLAALVGGAGPQVPRLLISIQPPTIQSPVSKRGPQEGSFPCNNRVNLTSGRPVGKKRRRKERTETCTIVCNAMEATRHIVTDGPDCFMTAATRTSGGNRGLRVF